MADLSSINLEENNTIQESKTDVEVEVNSSSNVEQVVLVQTFIDIAKLFIDKKTILISTQARDVINNIINITPNTLNDLEKAILEVIKDGKIDSKDIPCLIMVVQKIYQFIYSLKKMKFDNKKRAEIVGEVLKYIVQILVIEKKIKVDEDKQREFYLLINALIDSCVGLLSYPTSLKTPGCLKRIFG
jgi:hypothetical protein